MPRPHRIPHVPFIETYTPTPFGRVFSRTNMATEHPETVVTLVHGMIVSGNYMMPLAALLASHCRVHVIDLPGYGRSDKPSRTLSVPELADVLAEWMCSSRISHTNLIANSFGCQIVVDFAARYPNLVDHLVLQGPTVDPKARSFWRQLWRMRVNSRRESHSVGLISARDYKTAGLRRVIKTIALTLQDRIEEKLPLIQAPALVVRGEDDPVVPHSWAEEVTRLIPRAELREIPHAAHTLNYSEPEKFAALICSYLEI